MSVSLCLIIFFVCLVVGAFVIAHRMEKERTEAMRRTAVLMGFRFDEAVEPGTLGGFPLLQRGGARRVKNVLTGQTAGGPTVVCDYQYTVSSGKNSHTYSQTLAVFTVGGNIPEFELGPENLAHRLLQVFGFQDIDIEGDEPFSKKFLLRGRDEAAIRRLFTPVLRAVCLAHPDWSLQSDGSRLAVFKGVRRLKPEEISAFLVDSSRLLPALKA